MTNIQHEKLWKELMDEFVNWHNAGERRDLKRISLIEEAFLPLAAAYIELKVDGTAVTTGRKAVIRHICDRFASVEADRLSRRLDDIIDREMAEARRGG